MAEPQTSADVASHRHILMRYLATLAPTVLALLVQIVTFAITARGLGVAAFGPYTALLAVAAVAVELTGWGSADLLVRSVARDPGRFAVSFGSMLIWIAATLPLVMAGATGFCIVLFDTGLAPLSIVLLITGEVVIGRVAASVELIMVAHRQPARAGLLRLATAACRLVAACLYFLAFGLQTLPGWIVAAGIQSLLTAMIWLLLAAHLYGRPCWSVAADDWRTGGAFCLQQAARAFQGNADRMLLGLFADATSLGLYGAASRLMTVGLFPIQAATRLTYPQFFRHGDRGLTASRRYALSIAPVMLLIGASGAAVVGLAGWLAPSILGAGFSDSTGLAAMLGLALPLIALQYPPADALTGAGRADLRAAIALVSTGGFGLLLAGGVWLAGIDGLILAFVTGHALQAAALWTAAFLAGDA